MASFPNPKQALSAEEKAEISRQLTGYADTALELPAGDDVPLHHDCLRHAAAAASDHIMPMGFVSASGLQPCVACCPSFIICSPFPSLQGRPRV